MILIQLLELLLLIIILVFVILIYKRQHKESFDNCFGMQYYGMPFYDNYKNKICAKGTTEPLYPEGGCAVYDPDRVSLDYQEGKFRSAV